MISSEISDQKLRDLQDPTREALQVFSDFTDGRVAFDDEAVRFDRTPEKPNTARTQTAVLFEGEPVGDMYTIVFAPRDGTGDENTYKLAEIDTGVYPKDARVVPRSKVAAAVEGHLSLVSSFESERANPTILAGNLALLGFSDEQPSRVTEIGRLGQLSSDFAGLMQRSATEATPVTTLTTGTRGIIEGLAGERFGDPHAVYNPHGYIQVAAFITDLRVLRALGAVEPK